MQGRRFHNLLSFILLLSGLSIGVHAFDRLSAPSETVAPRAFTASPPSATLVSNESITVAPLPPLQTFLEIVARPLFSATRRPPAPQKVQKPKPIIASAPTPIRIETGQYTLVGIVIDEDKKAALLRKGRRGELMRVGIGQKLDGWTVDDIVADSVKLRQGDVVDLVLLRDNVLSQAEIKRLQKFKRKNERKRKAAHKRVQRQQAGQRLLNSKRRRKSVV